MVIPQWRHAFPATRRRGVTVHMREVVKPESGNRIVAIATAVWSGGTMELWDARVIELNSSRLVIGGFERIDKLGVPYDYAQSWASCRPLRSSMAAMENEDDDPVGASADPLQTYTELAVKISAELWSR